MPREIDNIERFDKQAQETKRRAIEDRLRASDDYPESRAVFSDWNRDLRNEGVAPIHRSGTITMPGHPELELVSVHLLLPVFPGQQGLRSGICL